MLVFLASANAKVLLFALPDAKVPDARYFAFWWNIGLKPIFHQKLGSRWLPNPNEIYTKNMKCTWPTRKFCIGYPLHLYSTDWRRGLASRVMQILGLASGIGVGVTPKYTNMLVSPMQNSGVGGITQRQPRCQVFCVAVEYRLKSPRPSRTQSYCW